ncbi:hypothetical protein L1049_009786 [Liquidambar formosana]|uniref:Uncharacterized protein n=1 Tax=Liquidambar formosana TaxID=63359 RepID=A0AAP0R6F8_LIQFO
MQNLMLSTLNKAQQKKKALNCQKRCSKLKAILSPTQGPKTTTLLHLEASYITPTILPKKKKMQYKASSITNKVTEDMAANTPVKIGTRGTVGSLVMREIDYFSKLEIDRHGNPQKPQAQIVGHGFQQ